MMLNSTFMKCRLLLCFAAIFSSLCAWAQVSPFIQVDQFGYRTNAEKVAVLSNPVVGYNAALSYAPPATLEVRNALTNAPVFSGPVVVWNNGATHGQSGDQGWWFDFSAVTASGSYYVFDAANNQRSATFEINANPYAQVMLAACKMFYYNRANMPKSVPFAQPKWVDGNNFLNPLQDANARSISDPANASLEKNLAGGWFDAGDYNKYVSFTHSPLHDLLYAFEENPLVFTDRFNIPESGNGVPDLIDELKWELDWLFKMTNADGSTHNKMGSRNYSENVASPPSANTDGRYYGPTCTSASATIASVFAHAALVFDDFPALSAYATQLRDKAISCFNYVLPFYPNALQTDCDNGSIVAGDADVPADAQRNMMVTAAIYLFEKTGNPTYNQFVIDHYASTTVFVNNFWGVDATELQDALLRYAKLPNANTTVANTILNAAGSQVSNNWNDFYGWTNADLYRAFMPDWSYHWGSNMPKADYANVNKSMLKAGLGTAASLNRKSAEQVHYFHGVNPQGLVYLSNMYGFGGDKCVNEIYHTWFNDGTIYDNALTSPNGPAPGFLVGGPNRDYTISTQSPPYNQPRQKSYLDFNTGWPTNSWEITEPAIYYQAAYIRLLAHYTSAVEDPLPVALISFEVKETADHLAALVWKTASETNNAKFEIERSVNGTDFDRIGQVAGHNTTTNERLYRFTDYETPQVTTYYRLKQVDFDGTFEYSKVAALYRHPSGNIQLAPNPVRDFVEIKMPAAALPRTVNVVSAAGKNMIQKLLPAHGKVDLSGLHSGLYIVTVSEGGRAIYSQRIFKN